MERPYFNRFERQMIRAGCLYGDLAMLEFRIKKLLKSIEIKFWFNGPIDFMIGLLKKCKP